MGQLDKTRENINVDSLNDTERKHLFNKMVKAGGQVVSEKPKKTIKIDRTKQREIQQKLDEHHRLNKQKSAAQSFSRIATGSASAPQADAAYSGGLSILGLRIGLSFSGVTNLGGEFFKKKFLEKFKVEYNPALMELQMLYLDLFKQNPTQGWKIIENLDKLRPLYFELIEMSADVYDISLPARLLDNYTALPNERYRVLDYRELIVEYFKSLYILYRYVDSLDFAFGKAFAFQQIVERGKSSVYSQKRKKAGNSIYIVFNKLFPKLHKLFCLIRGEMISLDDTRRIDEILGITPDLKPGNRIPNQPSSLFSAEPEKNQSKEIPSADDAAKKEAEDLALPDDVKNGLTLMEKADLNSLRAELMIDTLFKSVSQNDKVLISFLLFREFDKEYSFILTTYKMKFSPAHSIRGKSDYRARLADVYNQMRSCFDALKEYFTSLDVYEKARVDRPTSQDQYFPYTKRLNDLDREKKAKGRAAKNMLQNYMLKIIDETRILLMDMDSRREIVLNPQDVLEFDAPVEMTLKMKGRKIFEAVRAANEYASALYFRLSPGGDLYGEQVSDITEAPESVKNPGEPGSAPVQANAEVKPEEPGDKPKDKSILGELDDLV